MSASSKCPGCGASFAEINGPVHPYMESSAACWAAYGEVLAREYGDRAYYAVHKLTVDTYAAQHPGKPSKQAIGSVGLHLVRLCLHFEHGLDPEKSNDAILEAGRNKSTFVWLVPPESVGRITVADVAITSDINAHMAAVKDWAWSTWQAWSIHHEQIRRWLPASFNKADGHP